MNSINIIGRLTKDPTIKATGPNQDHPLCELRLAYNQAGDTGYINVTVWGKLATACGNLLSKGDEIGVSGRLDHFEWHDITSEESPKKQGYKITAKSVDFLRKASRLPSATVQDLEKDLATEQALDAAIR